jgi:hypothetical protein
VSDQPQLFFGCRFCVALDGQLLRKTVDVGSERTSVEVLLRERVGEESFIIGCLLVILASSPDEKTARLFRLLRYSLSLKKRKTGSYPSIESLLGIIRDAELWRLFRARNKRHTCAAWLAQAGVPLTQIRDLLGHSTIKVTERYAHLAPENTRGPVEVLDHESRSGRVQGRPDAENPVSSS